MFAKKIITSALTGILLLSSITLPLQAQQKQKHKPFLIQKKLPHLTKKIKKMWNDKNLALTKEQKKQLLILRKETLLSVKELSHKIFPLEKEIIQAAKKGVKPKNLKKKVNQLAKLRAEATMVHLNCLYKTKKILTPHQLKLLKKHKNKNKQKL